MCMAHKGVSAAPDVLEDSRCKVLPVSSPCCLWAASKLLADTPCEGSPSRSLNTKNKYIFSKKVITNLLLKEESRLINCCKCCSLKSYNYNSTKISNWGLHYTYPWFVSCKFIKIHCDIYVLRNLTHVSQIPQQIWKSWQLVRIRRYSLVF